MKLVFILCSIGVVNAFLLDSNNSSHPGHQTYLSLAEYYGDKSKIQQVIEKNHQEMIIYHEQQEKSLNLLASQIQDKLNAMDQRILGNIAANSQQTAITALEQKYQALEQKYAEMKNSSDSWKQKYNNLDRKYTLLQQDNRNLHLSLDSQTQTSVQIQQKLDRLETKEQLLKNETDALKQKVVNLEQLKGINQLQTLSEVQQKTQTLDTKVTALANTEQARSQDFIALYNKINTLENNDKLIINTMNNKFQEIEHNYTTFLTTTVREQKQAMEGLRNKSESEVGKLQESFNQSISMIQKNVEDQLQPVILTACHYANEYIQAGLMKFPHVKTATGISNLSAYNTTGKFRCQMPGYYFVIATLESWTDHVLVDIMLNSKSQYTHYVTGTAHGKWFPGSTAITMKLETNDEVWIRFPVEYPIYKSCLNVFKIK